MADDSKKTRAAKSEDDGDEFAHFADNVERNPETGAPTTVADPSYNAPDVPVEGGAYLQD